MSSLLEPITVGGKIPLRNRIAMSSLTRNRCVESLKPGLPQIQHYSERAKHGTGLIMTEGIFVDWSGTDWPHAPAMVTEDHSESWRKVVDAVHLEGGKIFYQAWHAGRCQQDQIPLMKEARRPVLAPSAVKAEGGIYRQLLGRPGHTDNLTVIDNPCDVIEQYRKAIVLAKNAGFDGVELLATGGYLPHQFLSSRANQRTDKYGGSTENRCRFVLELIDSISEVYGGCESICVKICPADFLNDSVVSFDEIKETYTYLIREMVKRKVGIICLCRRGTDIGYLTGNITGILTRPDGFPLPPGYDPVLDFGPLVKFPGSPSLLMVNHEYTVKEAGEVIAEGKADMVAFGRAFISNPDFVSRVRDGIELAEMDRGPEVFYGPYKFPDENYNDWPVVET